MSWTQSNFVKCQIVKSIPSPVEHFEGVQQLEAQIADVDVTQLLLVLLVEVKGYGVALLFDNVEEGVVGAQGGDGLTRGL